MKNKKMPKRKDPEKTNKLNYNDNLMMLSYHPLFKAPL